MSEQQTEAEVLPDDILRAINGGIVEGGRWTTLPSGEPWYIGWRWISMQTVSHYTGRYRRESLADGHANLWAMGEDGNEYLKRTV